MLILRLARILFLVIIYLIIRELVKKHAYIFLPGYFISKLKRKEKVPFGRPIHIIFAIVDHFEPLWNNPTDEQEINRVDAWVDGYPKAVEKHFDFDGKHPQHTWFYPYDEYRRVHLEKLKTLCNSGYGEIEIHLHHKDDTPESLREKLESAKREFSKDAYGFIHGNWTLDNSGSGGQWCGVNNELQILSETGCYADFTMPSAPSETQSKKINSLYYAKDDPDKPKSYNTGIDVEVNKKPSGDLLMIQGPLCLNWKKRKAFIFPTIENGNITSDNPPNKHRIKLWIKQHIHVKNRPEWIFVKIYTHGAQDNNYRAFLGKDGYLDKMYSDLEKTYNNGIKYKLHYVTAREMYNIIKAAEAGEEGEPGDYRDYIIKI